MWTCENSRRPKRSFLERSGKDSEDGRICSTTSISYLHKRVKVISERKREFCPKLRTSSARILLSWKLRLCRWAAGGQLNRKWGCCRKTDALPEPFLLFPWKLFLFVIFLPSLLFSKIQQSSIFSFFVAWILQICVLKVIFPAAGVFVTSHKVTKNSIFPPEKTIFCAKLTTADCITFFNPAEPQWAARHKQRRGRLSRGGCRNLTQSFHLHSCVSAFL